MSFSKTNVYIDYIDVMLQPSEYYSIDHKFLLNFKEKYLKT